MMQGDSYPLLIHNDDIDMDEVSKIEFVVGPLHKFYPAVVTYDETTQEFSFPLSQEETLQMRGEYSCQAHILYTDNTRDGMNIGTITIEYGNSKGVIA